MNRDERERFAELFSHLMHDAAGPDAATDPALRVLSHALLNYLGSRQSAERSDAGAPSESRVPSEFHEPPTGLDALARQLGAAMPWLGAFLDWTRGERDTGALAREFAQASGAGVLSASMIQRRLDALPIRPAMARGPAGRREARGEMGMGQDKHVQAVRQLAQLEARLTGLSRVPEDALLDHLLGDTALLAAAAELCESDAGGALAGRLRQRVAPWQAAAPQVGRPRYADALQILARLDDSAPGVDPLAQAGVDLHARTRGFARGLASNMQRLGLLSAVRAALAFAPPAPGAIRAEKSESEVAESGARFLRSREAFLSEFEVFRADPTLRQLALALMEVRGACMEYLRGGAPLASLAAWVDYLRDGCVEMAEARDCTLRETISYANYCLQLLNFCDLAAACFASQRTLHGEGWVLNEALRAAMCQVEDELKEFSLLGQHEGAGDAHTGLARFERARWRRAGDVAYLADRLSRLRGAWRHGVLPAPLGAPPRLDADISAHSLAVVDNLLSGFDEADIIAFADLVANVQLRGFEWIEGLTPAQILKLIATCAVAARDLPGIDIRTRFVVDLSPLGRWATDPVCAALNRRILCMLLDRRDMAEILNGGAEHGMLARGLVGHTRSADGRISAPLDPTVGALSGAPAAAQAHLVMEFIADAELRALLQLIATSTSQDAQFRDLLEQRLHAMLTDDAARAGHARPANLASNAREDAHEDASFDDDFDRLSSASGMN